MTREEYKEERSKLLNEALELTDAGKLDEAEAVAKKVEELDDAYAAEAAAAADKDAVNGITPDAPAFINSLDEKAEMEDKNMPGRMNDATAVNYKNAWLKEMARRADGKYLIGAPTSEEASAYTVTTGNTPSVVPKEVQDRIVDLVISMAPMYADATKTGLEKGFAVPRHKSITAGDAAVTAEGVANADEESVFDQLALDGVEIKKHVNITRKMSFQSIDAFESWLVQHIAKRIANAKDKRIISQLDTTTYGIAAANILTKQSYTDASLRKIMSLIKESGAKVIYANGNTIWNGLFGVVDNDGRQLFVPTPMDDPLVQGRIYGALVKQDENIPDATIYAGVPASILANDFDALATARDMDVKTWVTTISGYSLFDAALENPNAFVKASFQ